MKKLALLFSVSFLLAACSSGGDVHYITMEEKENEVLLTDFSSIHFALRCRVDSKSKNCGIVLGNFLLKKSELSGCNPNTGCSYFDTYYGFKEASFLTLQVKNENTGETKSLMSYLQDDIPYIKGDTYVPSVMNLNKSKDSINTVTLTGYYVGDEWVKHDTTIVIKDILYADKNGKISFSVSDAKKNRAALSIDISAVLEKNNVNTVQQKSVTLVDTSYTEHYWAVEPGAIAVEPMDINFEMKDSFEIAQFLNVPVQKIVYLNVKPLPDSLILSGGVNDRAVEIPVESYAK
ncbi:MAG: hypothetical protein IJ912_08890 [Fibrobacter sp.]|nr:hypothetical protein [Fibrobacter sp.]